MDQSIWHRRPTLDELNRASATIMSHLGIEFVDIGDDSLSARMPVDRRTHQPTGLLHGGASVVLAETLGSAAAYCTIDRTRFDAVGIEINANHVRGVRDGFVTGTARPLHLGRSTQLWEIRIENAAGKLVCISRLTIAVLEKNSSPA
jgi:1,4-dihydroxy-2-naphthoyl-CoA hydrolase